MRCDRGGVFGDATLRIARTLLTFRFQGCDLQMPGGRGHRPPVLFGPGRSRTIGDRDPALAYALR